MATEMQRKKITWPPGFLKRKKKNKQTKSCLFRRYFFMFTITLITEKVLGDEFRWKKTIQVKMSGSEKIKASMNTGNKNL